MTREELIEAVARGVNVRPRDVGIGVARDIPYDEIVSFIKAATEREGAFPGMPGDPQLAENVFLVRADAGWSVVWYVSPAGGAIPPAKYEKHFADLNQALEEFLRGYLPRPPRRVRHGAVFILP